MPKKNLLLVDADMKSARMLEVSLRQAGFTVSHAKSGEEAAKRIDVIAPDLLLTDTKLPGDISGLELVRRLKSKSETESIPIIFLSSEDDIEKKVRGLELGVEDYLTKPVYLREMLTRVRVLLEKIEKRSLAQSASNLSGRLGEMGLVDLIQTVEIGRKTGVIDIKTDDDVGKIYFREGRVCDAEAGTLKGPQAFYRLMVWTSGSFAMNFGDHDAPNVIAMSTQGLLMEGMRRVDEWGRLLEQIPPLDRVFEIDYGDLVDRLSEIPDQVNGILRLFDGQRTLLEVVDASDYGDLEALEVASKLYFEGLIFDVETREGVPQRSDDMERVESWLGGEGGDPFAAPLAFDAFAADTDIHGPPTKTLGDASDLAPTGLPQNISGIPEAAMPAPESGLPKAADANPEGTYSENAPANKKDGTKTDPYLIASPSVDRPVLLDEEGWEGIDAPQADQRLAPSVRIENARPHVAGAQNLAEDLGLSDEELRATLEGRPADTLIEPSNEAAEKANDTLIDDAPSHDEDSLDGPADLEQAAAFESEDSDVVIDLNAAKENAAFAEAISDSKELAFEDLDSGPTKVSAQPGVSFVDVDSRIERARAEEKEGDALIVDEKNVSLLPSDGLFPKKTSWMGYLLPVVLILGLGAAVGFGLRNSKPAPPPPPPDEKVVKQVDDVEKGGANKRLEPGDTPVAEANPQPNTAVKNTPDVVKPALTPLEEKALAEKEKAERDRIAAAELARVEADTKRQAQLDAQRDADAKLEAARVEAEKEKEKKEKAAQLAEQRRQARAEALKNDPYAASMKEALSNMRRGRFKSASEAYEKALEIKPNSGVAHKGLGNAYFERDRMKDAETHLNRAKRLLPNDPQVYLLLGAVHQSQGDKAKTIKDYERYLKLAPNGKHSRDVRSILKRLKG